MDQLRSEIYIKGGTYQTFADSLETVRKTLLKKYNIDSLIAAGAGRPVLFKIYDTVNKAVDKLYGNLDKITIAEAEAKLAAFKALPEYTSNKTVAKVEEIVNILKAIEEDNVEWLQVSESVFVDQEGKIIKRKSSHTEIEELLRSNL